MVNFSTATLASTALLLAKIVSGAPVTSTADDQPFHIQYFGFSTAYPAGYETLTFWAEPQGPSSSPAYCVTVSYGADPGKLGSIPDTACSGPVSGVTNSIDVNGTAATLHVTYNGDSRSYEFPEGSIVTDANGYQHITGPSEFDM